MKQFYFIWPLFHALPQHSTLSLLYSAHCGAWHRWQQEGGMGAFSRFFAIVSCSSVTMTFCVRWKERDAWTGRLGRGGHLRHRSQWGHWRRERWDCFLPSPFENTGPLRPFMGQNSYPKFQTHSYVFAQTLDLLCMVLFIYPSLKHSMKLFRALLTLSLPAPFLRHLPV